ncbi:uncharacterized protein [Panulirus ornatus]|uniref:uncharacterized protein n=1 Tax=Panulirus ornatus TaxID=150431 RepID=UPI003A8AD495
MCENQVVRFEGFIEIVNETKVARLKPVYPECPEDPSPIVAAAFLSLIFLGAFLLNLMVVVTIFTSYTLKKYLYCHLLINLSLACLIDCFFNLSIAIGYVTTTPWRFGYAVSYFNSFTINAVNSEMAYAVLLLAIDRLAAAKKFTTYLKKYKLGIVISVTWVVSVVLALPLLGGYIGSMPYRRRYSCSVADPLDDYYLIPHLVLIVCVPTVVMVVLVCIISVTFHRKRKKQKKLKGNQTMGYFDQILMTPYYRDEFYPSLLVNFVVIAYVVCWLPFTVLTTISPIMTQHWANDTSEDANDDQFSRFVPSVRTSFKVTQAMLDETQLQTLNRTNTSMSSSISPDMSNFTMEEGLIPEIMGTPAFDTVAVWFHFIFDVTVPILVFTVLRDVRAKCEALIMCCRPNSVDVASPKPTRPLYINRLPSTGTSSKKDKTATKSKKKSKNSGKNMVDFKTPILFSTSEGLHIRTVEETYLGMLENKPLLGFGRQNNDPKFVYNLCDVMLGYEDLTDFDGQYHIDDNYDFEKDPEAQDLGGGNMVVMGAQRVALGQTALKSPTKSPVEDNDEEKFTFKFGYRPPTPPKVQIMGNEPAENIGDTIEPDELKRKKGKKAVRFASKLTEEIPRSSTPESSIVNSSASSSRSSDSGIMADNERSSSQQGDEEKKPRFSVSNNRSRPAKKDTSKAGAKLRAPRRPAPVKKNSSSSNKLPGAKTSRKVVGSKVRNIKSRHISSLNSSQTSPESRSPAKPRRFSKHSVQPTRIKVATSTK